MPLLLGLHYKTSEPAQFWVYRRCAEVFRKAGIHLEFLPDEMPSVKSRADIFVVQQSFLPNDPSSLARPIIVEERADSSMPWVREPLLCDNVKLSFKVSLARREWLNVPAIRVHEWLLCPGSCNSALPNISEPAITKIKPGMHFGMFPHLAPWVVRAATRSQEYSWAERPIDAMFIGNTEFRSRILTDHRRMFCAKLRDIRNINVVCVPAHQLSKQTYFAISRLAKVIVSPWGYGELCYRDFEALLDECVLIKPFSGFLDTVGNILREGVTYLPCRADGADLEDVIHTALRSGDHVADIRRENRKMVLHWWDEVNIVKWWSEATCGKCW